MNTINFFQNLPRSITVIALSMLCIGMTYAQALPDPTRPADVSQTLTGISNEDKIGTTTLQSVVLPKGGKPIAIISGRSVSIGDKVDDARIINITESAVTLRGPEGVRILKMSPDVEKRSSSTSPSVKKNRATHAN